LVVGVSSAPHFIVQSGFWGFVGSTLVPVVLAANKVPADARAVDLTWSGNDAPYDVYKTTTCPNVFTSVFATTANNGLIDRSAPTGGLTCYNVLATAPGPSPHDAAATSP
jgi:hypothetical protein